MITVMAATFETDQELLEAVRANNQDAWGQLIAQFQGRLLNFARVRTPNTADAEDLVQETLTAFLNVLTKKDVEIASIEAYLFTILRNAICSQYRSRWSRSVCLIQDAFCGPDAENAVDAAANLPAHEPSVSGYFSQQEQADLQHRVLVDALKGIVRTYKEKQGFGELKLCDLLFYSRLPAKDITGILNLNESSVRVFKHRVLKQFQEKVGIAFPTTENCVIDPANTLPALWEQCRPTCPKYSTLGKFVREDLDPAWFDYIDFHLTTFGCHICRASYKDLVERTDSDQQRTLQERILYSTIGFFTQSD